MTDPAPALASWWSRWRRRVVIGLLLVVAGSAYATVLLVRSYPHAVDGKGALVHAQEAISRSDTAAARREFDNASRSFGKMRDEIDRLGPVGWVFRATPLVRVQIRAVDRILEAGELVASAGLELTLAAERINSSEDVATTEGRILPQLAEIHGALVSGATKAEEAAKAVHTLDNKRLLGPLDSIHDEIVEKLDPAVEQARAAERGVFAMETFFGKRGPRRYLVFSQNPEEVRPTGGYMGAFSVLSTSRDGVKVEYSSPIEDWQAQHPDVFVDTSRLGGVFQFSSKPSLANVNFLPDWNAAGRFAADLWKRGGEEPVDGVIGVTPAFLRELLTVTGPVQLSGGETVSGDTLYAQFAFHTRQVALGSEPDSVRKGFATRVATSVLVSALAAPRSRWKDLAAAMGRSFDNREAMMWASDARVAAPLRERRWDGVLPEGTGDFVYNAEFSFGAKNGRELRRTFDHHVVIAKDGSAIVTTTMTVANSTAKDKLNPTSMAYVVMYGPEGARFSQRSENVVTPHEVVLGGHPAAGFFVDPQPFENDALTVVWSVAALGTRLRGDSWAYDLRFMHVPDHTGDVVNLRVDLPRGWKWLGENPPSTATLDRDLVGSWTYGP